jgi:hypothetical protein
MALSQKHRSVLYDHFAPLVGDDAAEALMAQFPATEPDQLVTREHLRAELAEVRTEIAGVESRLRAEFGDLRAEFGDLRAEFGDLRGEFADLRSEVRAEMAAFRGDLADLRSDLVFRFTGTLLGALALATTVIIAFG